MLIFFYIKKSTENYYHFYKNKVLNIKQWASFKYIAFLSTMVDLAKKKENKYIKVIKKKWKQPSAIRSIK